MLNDEQNLSTISQEMRHSNFSYSMPRTDHGDIDRAQGMRLITTSKTPLAFVRPLGSSCTSLLVIMKTPWCSCSL